MNDTNLLPADAFVCPKCGSEGVALMVDAEEFAPAWGICSWREDGTPASIRVALRENQDGPTEIRELTREDVEAARNEAGEYNFYCGACGAFFAEPVAADKKGAGY